MFRRSRRSGTIDSRSVASLDTAPLSDLIPLSLESGFYPACPLSLFSLGFESSLLLSLDHLFSLSLIHIRHQIFQFHQRVDNLLEGRYSRERGEVFVVTARLDSQYAYGVSMTFVVVGEAEEGAVEASDVVAVFGDVGGPGLAADLQPRVAGRDSGPLADDLFQDRFHRFGGLGREDAAGEIGFLEAEVPSVPGFQMGDDPGSDEDPPVVEDIVGLKELDVDILSFV